MTTSPRRFLVSHERHKRTLFVTHTMACWCVGPNCAASSAIHCRRRSLAWRCHTSIVTHAAPPVPRRVRGTAPADPPSRSGAAAPGPAVAPPGPFPLRAPACDFAVFTRETFSLQSSESGSRTRPDPAGMWPRAYQNKNLPRMESNQTLANSHHWWPSGPALHGPGPGCIRLPLGRGVGKFPPVRSNLDPVRPCPEAPGIA